MGRAHRVALGLVMVAAAVSVAGTSLRRLRVEEELPAVAAPVLSKRGWLTRQVGAPLEVVEVRVRSWEQDEMDGALVAHLKVVGPSGARWVEVSALSIAGLPWALRVGEPPPAPEVPRRLLRRAGVDAAGPLHGRPCVPRS